MRTVNIKSGLLVILCLLCLKACSSIGYSRDIREVEAGVFLFKSAIDPESVNHLIRIIRKSPNKATTLIVNSGGGDAESGLKLGGYIADKQLNIIVREFCASSCANYLLTAGKSVLVEKDALIGWHGGSLQAVYVKNSLNSLPFTWYAKERRFFEKTGVNQTITILGIMPALNTLRDADLYSYDIKTLKALGLNIEFESEQIEHNSNGDKKVQIFKLADGMLDGLLQQHNNVMQGLPIS